MLTAQNLLERLVANKIITEEVVTEVQKEALTLGLTVEDVLVRRRLAEEEQILQAKAEALNVPFITLAGRGISPDVLSLVPEPVARRYTLVPFDIDRNNNVLHVAMLDPLDLQIIEFLEKKSGKRVKSFLAKEDDVIKAIDDQYSQSLAGEVTAALEDNSHIKTVMADNIGEIIKEAPIAKVVSTVLEYAVRSRASDVHIEPLELKTRIRYRIDGILHEKLALPKTVHNAVVSRIKILSGMKIDEKRIPQDGRFNFKLGQEEVDLRVSSLPTVHGEKIVMRLLKKTGGIPNLNELGLRGTALKNLEYAITRPHGIILVTGPTGSGKTTTLYSVLSKLNTNKVNIVTLEDPVEYEIIGLNQVQINPQAGLSFASGLRSFLRQDPNIILVGEIRDEETTQLAIQAALTGHLVFSTLHTNDASTAIPRLLDLKAEPFLIASVLNAVEGQRICRKICQSCKEVYDPPLQLKEDIKNILGKLLPSDQEVKLYKGRGCSECSNTGYLGRVGIFEVLPVSPLVARQVLEHASAAEIQKIALNEGMITIKQDGYLKVIEGVTSIEEVLRVAQD